MIVGIYSSFARDNPLFISRLINTQVIRSFPLHKGDRYFLENLFKKKKKQLINYS